MNDIELEHSHDPKDIAKRLGEQSRHSYLRDFVYGATDGVVTTFAIVSGVAGAQLGPEIVVFLGAANLVADGFSMAASNYLGTKAEDQMRENARRMELTHIQLDPEGEKEEVRQIFAAKGFSGDDLEKAVEVITRNNNQWVETMLVDEHGFSSTGPNPIKAAWATFLAFLFVGVLPLLPFFIGGISRASTNQLFVWSSVMTGLAFFFVGAAKSFFVNQSWWRSGLETFAIGGIAAGIAYGIGFVLRATVGISH